ncbi:J domain-containing protein [Henriciella aquimarina]|uniref:J domain-containing protein n=1 Tax=Henriciella aquimarina TaxID=545261 RepID=UPI001301ACB8|nr:J domain-containing protein [Henriciella aquimarina]
MFWKVQLHLFIAQGILVFIYIIWPLLKTLFSLLERAIGALFSSGPDIDDLYSDVRPEDLFGDTGRKASFGERGFDEWTEAARSKSAPTTREKHLAALGLGACVTSQEIRAAYRRAAKKYHPDRFASQRHSPAQRQAASERMRQVNEAYDWLMANR